MSQSVAPVFMVFVTVLAYVMGSIPFGLLLTRAAGLGDIRKVGSGNIGATNVLRTGRKGLAAGTLLLDGLKGALAVLMGANINGSPGALLCGVAVVLGHLFPIWLRFRGGKGVAAGFGVLIAASPAAGLAAGAIWLIVARLFRYSSAAALAAFLAAPVLFAVITRDPTLLLLAFVVAALIWARHGANLRRLLAGTEPKIGAK